jgi:fatty-acyl-CoA synthase
MPTATRDGVELYYEVDGPADAPTVVLIEGLGYGRWMWHWQREALSGEFELLLPDNRGTGRSDAPEGPYTMAQFSADLGAVLDAHGAEAVTLVGASMGGMIAMQHALADDRVERLVLLCTTPGGPDAADTPPDVQERITETPPELDERETIRHKMAPAVSEDFYDREPKLVDQIVDWRLEQDASETAKAAQMAAIGEFDASDRLQKLTQPTLVLHGTADRVVPVGNADLLSDLPNAEVQLIEEAPHLLFIEHAEAVNERLRTFLTPLHEKAEASQQPQSGEPMTDDQPRNVWTDRLPEMTQLWGGTAGRTAYDWVGDWTARRAQLSPQRPAVTDRKTGETVTYAELDRRANRAARLLDGHGVIEGERVAVISRNRLELLDSCFGAAKTGGVFAPLSHRLAVAELAELLEQTDPRLLLVEEPFAESVAPALERATVDPEPETLVLQADGQQESADTMTAAFGRELPRYSQQLPDDATPYDGPERALSDPHLFLHTGGSTGIPKQTVITHGSIVWNSLNTIASWGLRPDDVTPMVFPMFHTGGWNVLTLPLVHMGGHIVIDREVDAGDVLATIEAESATLLVAVPAVLRQLTEHERWETTDLSTLRMVKSGGGPCRRSVIERWRNRDVPISQGYGLTECGPNNFAMPDEWAPEKVNSVGKPGLHIDARVVDENGTQVSQGEVGELELRGEQAAAGYWDAPEETAATFGDGWVSTGDLVRVDDDGFYHVVGRKKQLFVSGGENVYPPAVEDAIADHPDVEEVVVIGVPDERWGTVGKAVVQGEESLTLADLETFLEDRLARFEIPAKLAFVDEMPTSGPSKIDRQAIEEQFGEAMKS